MKILEFTSSYPNCDNPVSGVFVQELSCELSRSFHVAVLAPGGRGMPECATEEALTVHRFTPGCFGLRFAGSAGGMLPLFRRKKYLWILLPFFLSAVFFRLRRTIRREAPDWVHVHWLIPFGVLAALNRRLSRRGPRVLVTCHGSDVNKMSSPLLLALKRFVLRHVDAVTAVSAPLRDTMLEQKLTEKEITVAPMGVETERFRPGVSAPDIRSRFGMPGRRYVLAVGSLIRGKGVLDLLEAMPEVRKNSGDIHLVYAGNGVLREELERRAAGLGLTGKVHFAGLVSREELPAFFAQADVFCLPSYSEGFVMVAQEAVSSGCPAVLSRLPAMTALEDSDRLFRWCDAGNVASIASALNAALAAPDDPEELDFRREYARKRFGVAAAAARYVDIFERKEADGGQTQMA